MAGTTTRDEIATEIKRRFRGTAGEDTIVRAINTAIRDADRWLVPKTDTTTVEIEDDTYSYDLPSDLVQLLQVWTGADARWMEVSPLLWRVTDDKLRLRSLDGLNTIRLEYVAQLDTLSTPSSTLNVGAPMEQRIINYICEFALHILHENEAAKAGTEASVRAHASTAQRHFEKSQVVLRTAFRDRPAGRTHGWPFARSRG